MPSLLRPLYPLFALTLGRHRGHWHVAFAFELTVIFGTLPTCPLPSTTCHLGARANLGSLQFWPGMPGADCAWPGLVMEAGHRTGLRARTSFSSLSNIDRSGIIRIRAMQIPFSTILFFALPELYFDFANNNQSHKPKITHIFDGIRDELQTQTPRGGWEWAGIDFNKILINKPISFVLFRIKNKGKNSARCQSYKNKSARKTKANKQQ